MPDYDRQNFESARIILSDPAKYGGESAALVDWARRATARIHAAGVAVVQSARIRQALEHPSDSGASEAKQGELFQRVEARP